MFPMDRKPTPVTVEYNRRGERVSKTFSDAFQARRFYTAQDRLGHFPKIVAVDHVRSETMTTETTTTEATPATPSRVKKTAKKAATKKATKTSANGSAKAKTVKKEKKAPIQKPAKSQDGVKWSEKRVAVVNALKTLKATSATNARSAADIAAKAKLEEHEIKHYCYKDEPLVMKGYVGITQHEDVNGLCYHLTAKGAKLSF